MAQSTRMGGTLDSRVRENDGLGGYALLCNVLHPLCVALLDLGVGRNNELEAVSWFHGDNGLAVAAQAQSGAGRP